MAEPNSALRLRFGKALREARTASDLSQEELAERAALHATYISYIERGRGSPSLDALAALASALGMLPSELVRRAE